MNINDTLRIVIVGHGRSDSLAIKSAVRLAKETVERGTLEAIRSGIEHSLSMIPSASSEE